MVFSDRDILPQPDTPQVSPFDAPASPPRIHSPSPILSPPDSYSEPSPTAPSNSSPTAAPDLPRRSERVRRFPRHLHDFAAHVQPSSTVPEDSTEFLTFQQAHLNSHWKSAMQAEIDSIRHNQTWSLVPLPPDKKAISSKWVYKLKPGTTGNPTRYKARIVARGFEQQDGVDFLETFAPVVRWETIRVLIAIAVSPQLATPSVGCSHCLLEWHSQGGCLHVPAPRFCESWRRTPSL